MAIGGGGFLPGGGGSGGGSGTTYAQINVQTNIDQSVRQFHQLNQTINNFSRQVQQHTNRANSSFANMAKGWDLHLRRINANAVLTGFAFVGLAGKASDFIERGAKMELFAKQMETVSGSVQAAQKDMGAIIDLAKNVPFKIDVITRGFIKLKSAGIEPIMDSSGNGPLKSLIDAMAAFSGTSEQLDRAILALTQMSGKGTVSMEELRQQLGESIPTAMRIAAREMHMTVAQFIKDVGKGKITWEEFAKVFFAGLDKNYAGAAAKLMNTFTGSLARLDTGLDVLAKTIFVDTNSMRYFTAAVQLATDKVAEFDKFMKTPQGQKWIDDIWEGFKQVVRYAEDAIKPVEHFVEIIGSIAQIVARQTGSLPAEIVGGGLIGYILFGKAGALGGVILGAFGDDLSGAAKKVDEFLGNTDASFNSYGGTLANAAIGGLIGYRLAGPYGALAGAVAAALASAQPEISKFVSWVSETISQIDDPKPQLNIPDRAMTESEYNKLLADYQAALDAWTARHPDALVLKAPVSIKTDLETPDLMSQMQQKADAMKEAFNNTLTYITSSTAQAAQKIDNIKLGDFTKWFPSKEDAVEQLTAYQATVEQHITQLQNKLTELNNQRYDPLALNIDKDKMDAEIAQYEEALKKAVAMRNDVISNLDSIKVMPDDVATGTDQLLLSIQNFAAGIDTSFESVDAMKAKMAEWSDQIAKYKEQVDSSNLSEQQKIELNNALAQAQTELAGAMGLVNEKAVQQNPAIQENDKAVAQLNRTIHDYQARLQELGVNASWTEEAERVGQASSEIQAYLDDIAVKIAEIQAQADKGLISQSTADQAIAALNAMGAAADGAKGKLVNAATDAGQAWSAMGRDIYNAIENALGDAIYGLVTKTKSMKEVLVDLWNAVTRAVSNYLAKLIMSGLFGGGSSGGGLFGSLFGSNMGSQLSFAGGGTVDGRTGFDNNVMAMRVSRGERVTVETAAQQRANDRSSSGRIYNIYALDGDSVEKILMRHGGVLQRSIGQRERLNHQ